MIPIRTPPVSIPIPHPVRTLQAVLRTGITVEAAIVPERLPRRSNASAPAALATIRYLLQNRLRTIVIRLAVSMNLLQKAIPIWVLTHHPMPRHVRAKTALHSFQNRPNLLVFY